MEEYLNKRDVISGIHKIMLNKNIEHKGRAINRMIRNLPTKVFNEKHQMSPFTDDLDKMSDFAILSKEDFLASYSYLTEEEYDLTSEACKNKK